MTISTPFNTQPETTGKYLVLLRENEVNAGIQALSDSAGVHGVARSADFEGNVLSAEQLENAETLVFDNLGVAVVDLDPDQLQSLSELKADSSSVIEEIEPERIVYALSDVGFGKLEQPISSSSANVSVEYLQGYRDAVTNLVDNLIPTEQGVKTLAVEAEATVTWGLQATKVVNSRFSGRGIKVAVLDTGFDLTHPDFVGRKIISKSFVDNEEVQDKQGHGTHCIGTACGPLTPSILPRYGVAYDAEIYVGKVLSNQGSGSDTGILAGITWAIANGCRIISMSLGARVEPGQAFSKIFEAVGGRALRYGTLIIAAAGNDSNNPRDFRKLYPVSHPANCPSIMAVAALNSQLQVADFSNRGLESNGGHVDIAGPGVNVYSSWPMQKRYNTISGTSMATPHVAGIAALYAEANPNASAQALWNLLTQNARRLSLPSTDAGIGLVQAP
jgi:subtilisin family serine protease